MTIDGKKLEEALEYAQQAIKHAAREHGTATLHTDWLAPITDAASAYAATLPREVEGWRCNWTYQGYPGGYQWCETQEAAMDYRDSIMAKPPYSDVFISWPHTAVLPRVKD